MASKKLSYPGSSTNNTEKNLKVNDNSQSDFAFLCTICWQNQPHGARPKVLGQSARIVCEKCWCAVLDLSICWVCGETVVRGDEVVSLGWCFWHTSCFGCLVCGMRISLPRHEDRYEVNSEKFKGNSYSSSRYGVELETVPLCEVCEIEMEGEGKKQVLERGLVTVSMFDGGLSRQRFEYMGINDPQNSTITSFGQQKAERRFNNSSSSGDYNVQFSGGSTDDLSPLLDNAANISFSKVGDANYVDENNPQGSNFGSESDAETMGSSIYLSIFDPLGDIAFRPSLTKPIPKWMNMFPKDMRLIQERKTHLVPAAICLNSEEAEIFSPSMKKNSNNVSEDTINHTPSSLSYKTFWAEGKNKICSKNLKNNSKNSSQARPFSNPSSDTEITPRANRGSYSLDTIYSTPPEFPLYSTSNPV